MAELEDRPVLDSDVLIDYLRGSGPGADLLARLRDGFAYWTTAISAFELALGRSYATDPRPIEALLAAPLLPLNRTAGLRAGRLLANLREQGRPIDVRDAMQAGICLDAGLVLVTRNRSHFDRVEGLRVRSPEEIT